jgi:hypothetical protein
MKKYKGFCIKVDMLYKSRYHRRDYSIKYFSLKVSQKLVQKSKETKLNFSVERQV